MRNGQIDPRIAWIAPFTSTGREHFPIAQDQFLEYGFSNLEYCDIDENPNDVQLNALDQYDVIYLTGGDPIGFRRNILRSGLSTQLQKCIAAGCLVVAASGGSMQLTSNISLFRLLNTPLHKVMAEFHKYHALGMVEYEILPHVNRLGASFLEKVRRYSERLTHDVYGLSDGAALLHTNTEDFSWTGQITRFRKGKVDGLETA